MEGTTFKNKSDLFKYGTGPGLEPVGGEFQPSFETAHPGADAYPICEFGSIFVPWPI